MKLSIKKNQFILLSIAIIWSDACYLKSAEKFTNSFTYFLEEIIKLMTFQKNYASPKTCRYLRIVDNGIVLV